MRHPPVGPTALWLLVCTVVAVVATNDLWSMFGFHPTVYPFGDLSYVLSALECTREGIDVVSANPCDVRGRRFIYPPAWLDLYFLPLDATDTVWLGLFLAVAYITVATWVLRPSSPVGMVTGLLLLLSPSSLYLMERGNVDAILFMLVVGAVWMCGRRHEAWRISAAAIATAATLLKVYPLVVFTVVLPPLRKARRNALVYLVFLCVIGALYVLSNWSAILRFVDGVPFQQSLAMFGAVTLPWSIEIVMGEALPGILKHKASIAALFLALVGSLYLVSKTSILQGQDRTSTNAMLFVAGGGVLVFCFLIGINVAYRLVYAIMMAPYLLEMVSSRRALAQRVIAFLLLSWSLLSTWNLVFIEHLIEHLAGLESSPEVLAFKPWLDAYILLYQFGTWWAMAMVVVMAGKILRRLHFDEEMPSGCMREPG